MSTLTMHSQHSKHTEEVQRTERFSSLPPSWGSAAIATELLPLPLTPAGAGNGESDSRRSSRRTARRPQKLACGLRQ